MTISVELKKPLNELKRWVKMRLPYRPAPNVENYHKIKQQHPDLLADVLAYTRLPEATVARLLSREIDSFTAEWNSRKVKDDYWFYLSSKGYFWANLPHVDDVDCYVKLIRELLPNSGSVLEYGGGVGHISYALAKIGYQTGHLELSAIQKDFLRFRASRNKVPITVVDIWSELPREHYDAVLALDVFEHVSDAERMIREQIGPSIKKGGYLIDFTEFVQTPKDPMHLTKEYEAPLMQALDSVGLRVTLKHRDYRVWRKSQ